MLMHTFRLVTLVQTLLLSLVTSCGAVVSDTQVTPNATVYPGQHHAEVRTSGFGRHSLHATNGKTSRRAVVKYEMNPVQGAPVIRPAVTKTKMDARETLCRQSMTEYDEAYRSWRAGTDLWYKLSLKTNRDLVASIRTKQYGRAGKDVLQELKRARSNAMVYQPRLGLAQNSLRELGNERTTNVMNNIDEDVMKTDENFFDYSLSRWRLITNIAHGRRTTDPDMASDPFHQGISARDDAASRYRATLAGQSCVPSRR